MAQLKDITEYLKSLQLVEEASDHSTELTNVRPGSMADENTLTFLWEEKYLDEALSSPAPVLITNLEIEAGRGKKILFSPNPYLAMAKCLSKFFPNDLRPKDAPDVHPSAHISKSAQIGKNVYIAAGVSIHDDVLIGDGCMIRENSIIESRAKLGAGTHIHPHVVIGRDSVLGKECTIQSFTVIGAEGFGYAPDEKNVRHPIVHKGHVVLGDRVDLGAHVTVDRGTLGETRIGNDCKIDNHIHLGHNFELGERGTLAGGFMSAGSTKIGKDFLAGGHCLLSGHLNITDGVVLAASTVARSDIRKPGVYGGEPPQPINEYRRNLVVHTKLAEMKKNISKLMKAVFEEKG